MSRREEEYLIQNVLRAQLQRGQLNRRQFITRMMAAGLGLSGISAAIAGCMPAPAAPAVPAASQGGDAAVTEAERALTPTFYQWIVDLHPSIPQVNAQFDELNFQIAPVEGFGIERFVAEARNEESTWDVYVGMTPFVEMTQLIEADVIEPWDSYIPQDVLDDLIPSIREECTVDGQLYSWPFLLDVIGMGWNSDLTDQAGITSIPTTWDEYLAASQQIVDSGTALYGCTFDAHGWRSLVPFTHSLSTDVYTDEGLFAFTSEPAIEALKLMKQMMALSHPDILLEGATDGGVNGTPDEVAFAAQRVAYYTKYFNAPLRMAANWPDPSKLKMAGLPKFANGEGSTVFWTTGACLFKYGKNKEAAAEYVRTLTYDQQIWQDSIAGSPTAHPGQLPPYTSLYAEWDANPPDWLPDFVGLIREQLPIARAINNHLFGLSQFQIGKPFWDKYLTGEETDPMAAMQATQDAVLAELAKTQG
jgi:ABC-type glycerol-3-phosphate transport system substrate-binding protein